MNNLYIIKTTFTSDYDGDMHIDHETLPFAYKSREEAFKRVKGAIANTKAEDGGYIQTSPFEIYKILGDENKHKFTVTYEIQQLIIMD